MSPFYHTFLFIKAVLAPYKKNIHDRKYTIKNLSQIDDNRILAKLAVVKEIIINKFPNLIVSKEQILTFQDPCILITEFI